MLISNFNADPKVCLTMCRGAAPVTLLQHWTVDAGCYLSLGKSFSNTKARAEDEMSCALRVVMGGHCVASQWHPLRCVFVNHLIFILQ